jgi:hypothetical protein
MANKKISELTVAGALTGTELVELVQGGVNKQSTAQDIADLASGGVSSVNGRTGAVTGVQDTDNSAVALVDAASMDLTAIKHTLTTSSATRTFTISYTGDEIKLKVTLNATSSTFTFPATALCVSEGTATGDNTCPLAGVSGDKYLIVISKTGSDYEVICKNLGQ